MSEVRVTIAFDEALVARRIREAFERWELPMPPGVATAGWLVDRLEQILAEDEGLKNLGGRVAVVEPTTEEVAG